MRATVQVDLIGSRRRGFCATWPCILNSESLFLDGILWVGKAHGTAQPHQSTPFTASPLPLATKNGSSVTADILFRPLYASFAIART